MLSTVLSQLTDRAVARPAQPVAHRCTGGLCITVVYYELSHQFSLVLARDRNLPSLQEWKTVLDNWPYPTRAKPNSGSTAGRHYLAAMLPIHPKLL
jgi:hypothetical protein